MPTPFLSSEEYDERAHQLYNEGKYDDALATLREGLAIYPNAVELHVGVGYARMARDEFAWARRAFEEALILDADHEDALAGLGEVLLKLGQRPQALRAFHRTLELGYQDDIELMLQIGRALFRDGELEEARAFFEVALQQAPDNAEAVALVGYAQHRLGDDDGALKSLRRALRLDPDFAEARVYLGNFLYDRGDYEGALYHLGRTGPEDHWDELGIWRHIELLKSVRGIPDGDPLITIWEERLGELAGEPDVIDELLASIEQAANDRAEEEARGQLELFGALLEGLAGSQAVEQHEIVTRDGRPYRGSWDQIVSHMHEAAGPLAARSLQEYMQAEARRGFSLTGALIPTSDAESFLRGSADAGLLRIVR